MSGGESRIAHSLDAFTLNVIKRNRLTKRNRLNKELTSINNEIDIINKRLNNPMFIEKAPSNVINEVKIKQNIFTQRKLEIEKALLNI